MFNPVQIANGFICQIIFQTFLKHRPFCNRSATIPTLIWPEKTNLVYFKKFFKLTYFSSKMWEVRIIMTPKRQEKCENSTSSLYWQSGEDQNYILLDASGSTWRRSKLRHKNIVLSRIFTQFWNTKGTESQNSQVIIFMKHKQVNSCTFSYTYMCKQGRP